MLYYFPPTFAVFSGFLERASQSIYTYTKLSVCARKAILDSATKLIIQLKEDRPN
jgi:hypothetical protein